MTYPPPGQGQDPYGQQPQNPYGQQPPPTSQLPQSGSYGAASTPYGGQPAAPYGPPGSPPPPPGSVPPGGGWGGPPSPPPRKNLPLIIGAAVLAVILVAGLVYFLTSGDDEETTTAGGTTTTAEETTSEAAEDTTTEEETSEPEETTSEAETTTPEEGGEVSIDVEVGECITLSGDTDSADAEVAACGTPESNYKVIGKAATQDECATDSDQTYFETQFGSELGALCLNIDFILGECMDVGNPVAVRLDCAATGTQVVRATDVVTGTVDPASCPAQSYVYDVQQFVVCLDAL